MKTARYFKPEKPASGRNYFVTRQTRSGKYVPDQLAWEGLYTESEMNAIVHGDLIPGEWKEYSRLHVGYIFGLRQYIGVPGVA